MATRVAFIDRKPTATIDNPYIPLIAKESNTEVAKTKTEGTALSKPLAKPKIIFMAGPALDALTIS
jgi:hypothetical protein